MCITFSCYKRTCYCHSVIIIIDVHNAKSIVHGKTSSASTNSSFRETK